MINIKKFYRLKDIIGCKEENITPIIPMGRSTFMNGVKNGVFPKPIKVGRSSFWHHEDIDNLLNDIRENKFSDSKCLR